MKNQALPRVLMLGWEFPPVYTGGLGIACQALAECLVARADLTVVVPVSPDNYSPEGYSLFNIADRTYQKSEAYIREGNTPYEEGSWRDLLKKHEVDVPLDPYEIYEPVLANEQPDKIPTPEASSGENDASDDLFESTSLYDGNLGSRINEFAARIVALVKEKEIAYDIIYAHDWMTFAAALALKEISGKPLVLHVHSTDYDRTGGATYGNFTSQLEKEALSLADGIITVSGYTAQIIENIYKVDHDKISIVYNGHSFRKLKKTKEPFRFPEKLVLFLGRVTAQKGPDFFFRILHKVAERVSGVRFVMAGTGDRLKNAIETSTYSDYIHRIHFTGHLDREEVYRLYNMSDIYCMPSVSEPFGLTALEAAYMGLPCVLSRQSGVSEVLSGALSADYYDVDRFADHIVDLLQDDKLYTFVQKAQRKALKELTWDKSSQQVADVFEKLLNQPT